MKLNRVDILLTQVEAKQVDRVYIVHDCDSEKVMLLNETASLIWQTLLDYERRRLDIMTIDIAAHLLEVCGLPQAKEQEVSDDVEEALQRLFNCGLISEVGRKEERCSRQTIT